METRMNFAEGRNGHLHSLAIPEPQKFGIPKNDKKPKQYLLDSSKKKKKTSRNVWGNSSYADLISQAIQASRDKRLTLSQIYDWMVETVPYFRGQGNCRSSAGWKNAVRHNLSLHSKFVRVINRSGGSSWWMIDPNAETKRRKRSTKTPDSLNSLPKTKPKRERTIQEVEESPSRPCIINEPQCFAIAECISDELRQRFGLN